MKYEEQQLEQMKQKFDAVPVPDSINDAIQEGIHRGRKKKRNRFNIRMTALAACLFIVVMGGAIRISPAFAAYVSSIPGMDAIVKLIRYDKGLRDAVQHGFIRPVHVSDSHDGVTFTVNSVIADDSRMILFYSVKAKPISNVNIQSVNLLNKNGKNLQAAIGYDTNKLNKKEDNTGKITASYEQNVKIPDVVTVKTKIETANGIWSGSVNVPIDKKRFKAMKQILPVHQTVMMQNQKIHFEKAIIYPTRIAVYVKFDPHNSKQIFGFDKLKLVDGKGETWATIQDGISGNDMNANEHIIYFQSNYFRKPKALYLEGSSVRALDKDQLNLVVGLKHGKLLKKPSDGRIKLYEVKKFDHKIRFGFTIKTNKWNDFSNFIPATYHDATGKTFSSILRETATEANNGSNVQNIQFTIKNEHFQGPLTFRLADYPTPIKKPFKIKIK